MTKPMLAPSCTQASRIWASRSRVLASSAGSSAATFTGCAFIVSPENENVARRARPGRDETARAHQFEAKAVASVQTMERVLNGQLESAVREIEMMFETQAGRKQIVDAGAGRQLASQKLAVEADRRRRDQKAAEAGGRIDPFPLFALPDKRWRVVLDIGKQAGDRCPVRSGEPAEHRGGRAHLAILDPRQGSPTHSAQRRQFIERPALPAPQGAQAFGEADIRAAAGLRINFHIRNNILDNESVKAQAGASMAGRIARAALLLHTRPSHNGMGRCRRRTTPPFRPGPGPCHCSRALSWR